MSRIIILVLLFLSAPGMALAGETGTQPGVKASAAKPVEVVEFFSFGCPHCAHLAPGLEAWVAKQGSNIKFKRVPVAFGRTTWYRLGLMYLALEDIGRMTPEMHLAIFKAIHEQHLDLDQPEAMAKWLSARKVDMVAFTKAFNKSSQNTRIVMAERRLIANGATGVPALLINNKHLVPSTSPARVIGEVDERVMQQRNREIR